MATAPAARALDRRRHPSRKVTAHSDQKNIGPTFTPRHGTPLNIDMRYLLQLNTAAGIITLGPFDTLSAARTYAAPIRGAWIIELYAPPADIAATQAAGTIKKLLSILDNPPPIP